MKVLVIFSLFAASLAAPSVLKVEPDFVEYKQTQKGDENWRVHIKNVYVTLPDLTKLITGSLFMDGFDPNSSPEISEEECVPPYCFDWNALTANSTKRPQETAILEEKPTTEKPVKIENVMIISPGDRLQLDTQEPILVNLEPEVQMPEEPATNMPEVEMPEEPEAPAAEENEKPAVPEVSLIDMQTDESRRTETVVPPDTLFNFQKPSEDVIEEVLEDEKEIHAAAQTQLPAGETLAVLEVQPESSQLTVRQNTKASEAPEDLSRIPIRSEDAADPDVRAKVTVGADKRPIPKLVDEILIPVQVVMERRF